MDRRTAAAGGAGLFIGSGANVKLSSVTFERNSVIGGRGGSQGGGYAGFRGGGGLFGNGGDGKKSGGWRRRNDGSTAGLGSYFAESGSFGVAAAAERDMTMPFLATAGLAAARAVEGLVLEEPSLSKRAEI